MTAATKSVELGQRLEELRQWRQAKDLTLGIGKRLDDLSSAGRDLHDHLASLFLLRSRIEERHLQNFATQKAAAHATLLALKVACSTPGNVLTNELHGPAVESLRNVVAAARALVQAGWREIQATHPARQRGELLAELRRLGHFVDEVSTLTRIQRELEVLAGTLLPRPSDVEKCFGLVKEWNEAWAPIEKGLPPDVADFLTRATSDGAELTLLSDAVREWLRIHNLEMAFRVRTK